MELAFLAQSCPPVAVATAAYTGFPSGRSILRAGAGISSASSEGSIQSSLQTTFPGSLRGLARLFFSSRLHFLEEIATATVLQRLTRLLLPESFAADGENYISQETQQRRLPEAAGELRALARGVKRETDHGGSSVVANEVRGDSGGS